MKLAIIGTRCAPDNIAARILLYIPADTTEIVSGGAVGVDKAAEQVAKLLSLPFRLFLPDYSRYGRNAPLERNMEIITYSDEVLAFWDGSSRGTMHCITACIQYGKPVRIIPI